jgi:hypothetical protein
MWIGAVEKNMLLILSIISITQAFSDIAHTLNKTAGIPFTPACAPKL